MRPEPAAWRTRGPLVTGSSTTSGRTHRAVVVLALLLPLWGCGGDDTLTPVPPVPKPGVVRKRPPVPAHTETEPPVVKQVRPQPAKPAPKPPAEAPADFGKLRDSAAAYRSAPWSAPDTYRARIKETGVAVARKMLADGDAGLALRAVSLAGMASGDPVAYLNELANSLSAPDRAALWPGAPYLVAEGFEDHAKAPALMVNEQRRDLVAAHVSEAAALTGGHGALIDIGPARAAGRCWFRIPLHAVLPEEPFLLAVHVKEQTPSETHIVVRQHFPEVPRSREQRYDAAVPVDGAAGWKRFEIPVDFPNEREAISHEFGRDCGAGRLSEIILAVEGPANTFFLDTVEIRLKR